MQVLCKLPGLGAWIVRRVETVNAVRWKGFPPECSEFRDDNQAARDKVLQHGSARGITLFEPTEIQVSENGFQPGGGKVEIITAGDHDQAGGMMEAAEYSPESSFLNQGRAGVGSRAQLRESGG